MKGKKKGAALDIAQDHNIVQEIETLIPYPIPQIFSAFSDTQNMAKTRPN